MAINNELAGKRFGKLLVLPKEEGSGIDYKRVPCLCDCGRLLPVTKYMLENGKTTNCGCVDRNRKRNDMYPARIKGLDALASAIVERAAADYRLAYMGYLKNKNENGLTALRRFFKSEWCMSLTELDTDALMNRIEQECMIEFERKKKHGKHKNQVPQGHSAD